jgi:uncharacterized phage-associated protein
MGGDCVTMDALAEHILGVARINNVSVTSLQLQKVMFFSLKEAINRGLLDKSEIQKIYDRPFEVWRYGPVERKFTKSIKCMGLMQLQKLMESTRAIMR